MPGYPCCCDQVEPPEAVPCVGCPFDAVMPDVMTVRVENVAAGICSECAERFNREFEMQRGTAFTGPCTWLSASVGVCDTVFGAGSFYRPSMDLGVVDLGAPLQQQRVELRVGYAEPLSGLLFEVFLTRTIPRQSCHDFEELELTFDRDNSTHQLCDFTGARAYLTSGII